MPRFPRNPDAPRFEPRAWIEQHDTERSPMPGQPLGGFDCYQYAIAGSHKDGGNNVYNEIVPGPGETRGLFYEINAETMPRLLESDGLVWAGSNRLEVPANRPGYYVVGVYLQAGERFTSHHFVRQNNQGGWDEKDSADPAASPREVAPPAQDGGYRPLEEMSNGRRFLGYALVPREGIDAGPEAEIRRRLLTAAPGQECDSIRPFLQYIDQQTYRDPGVLRDSSLIAAAMAKPGRSGLEAEFLACVGSRIEEVTREQLTRLPLPAVPDARQPASDRERSIPSTRP